MCAPWDIFICFTQFVWSLSAPELLSNSIIIGFDESTFLNVPSVIDESVVKDFLTTEKSGRKISAQTRAILDKIKACGDELEKCQETLKGCGEALRKALAELDEPEPEEDTEEEKQYVELPDSIEVELPS